jgi:hypothetical protein
MRTALILCLLGAACAQPTKPEAPRRATLYRTGGTTFEIAPTEGQHPYCLVYTVSKTGLTRLLTMSRRNESFECAAGRPIGGHAYRVPLEEGPVKVYTLFTTQAVSAASVSQQLLDQKNRLQLSVMDMRLPGAAALESLDFSPVPDEAATLGEMLGAAEPPPQPSTPAPPATEAGDAGAEER